MTAAGEVTYLPIPSPPRIPFPSSDSQWQTTRDQLQTRQHNIYRLSHDDQQRTISHRLYRLPRNDQQRFAYNSKGYFISRRDDTGQNIDIYA
ncbi:MAG: hypothetical protein PVI60_12465 [Desulfobacteraceae bacterium]|jgi:hypothetical protein